MKNQGKPVVLVTGASSGIGKDFALRLIREGYIVYGAARRVDKMQDIAAAGGHAVSMDVSDDVAMIQAVDRIIREQGRIDVLINNAGYGQMGALEDVPMEAARRQLEVNVIGVARLVQLTLPHMRAQKSGRIVNISTIGGKAAVPFWRMVLRVEARPRRLFRLSQNGSPTFRHRCGRDRARWNRFGMGPDRLQFGSRVFGSGSL